MSLNRIILIGRLTRDPESKTIPSGQKVTDFSVAVDKRIKPKDGSASADFFNAKAWGQAGEYLAQYGSKGRLVSVEGRMESRKYTDRDGNAREIWEVVADQVSLLDKAKEEGQRESSSTPVSDGTYDPFEND